MRYLVFLTVIVIIMATIIIIDIIIISIIILINLNYDRGEPGKIPNDGENDDRNDVDGAGKRSNLFDNI